MPDKPVKDRYQSQIETHRKWLAPYPALLRKWEKLLSQDPEPAICEAALREELSKHVQIEPAEEPDSGGLDFLCTKKSALFYVECTCIKNDTVERKSGIRENQNFGWFQFLTQEFWNRISKKADQFARYPDTIRILAVVNLSGTQTLFLFNDQAAKRVKKPFPGYLSALMLCGFGLIPPFISVLPNPAAERLYDCSLLPYKTFK